ncbi:MAG: P-loop NTPase [Deltaproteobacteria bacterium]|nr:P-loop NTPase [Deltaproteobacteria bacterium]
MRIFRELDLGEATESSIIEEENRVRANLAGVRAIVAFGSARGGVGKSALLVNIAAVLAGAGRKIAIVDADLNSPSIITMLGMKSGRRAFMSEEIEPAAGPLGLRIVSSDFLPEGEPPTSFVDIDETPAAPQNGAHPNEFGYLATMRRLLGQSRFGILDLILVDLASGIEHIYRLLKIVPRAKLVLASHPSELSARATRAATAIPSQHQDSLIGVVENMAGFNCDGCHRIRPLMPYGALAMHTREAGVLLLERLPFDPRFAESCDRGVIFVREYPQTPMSKQLVALAQAIDRTTVEERTQVGVTTGS